MVGWHVSLIWKWQRFTVTGGHQGEGKKRWLFSSSSLTVLPQALDASLCLPRGQALPVFRQELLAGLITKGKLFGRLSKTKTSLSLCPGGKSCLSHLAPFAVLSLLGTSSTPSPIGNSTYPLVPSCWTRVGSSAFSCSLPFGLERHLCGLLFCGVTGTVLCPEQRGLNNQPLYL